MMASRHAPGRESPASSWPGSRSLSGNSQSESAGGGRAWIRCCQLCCAWLRDGPAAPTQQSVAHPRLHAAHASARPSCLPYLPERAGSLSRLHVPAAQKPSGRMGAVWAPPGACCRVCSGQRGCAGVRCRRDLLQTGAIPVAPAALRGVANHDSDHGQRRGRERQRRPPAPVRSGWQSRLRAARARVGAAPAASGGSASN